MNVGVFLEHVPDGGKGLVGGQAQAVGVADQGIAGNAGALVEGAAEASVDHHQLAAGLQGAFAFPDLDGGVAVDDVGLVVGQAELPEHP